MPGEMSFETCMRLNYAKIPSDLSIVRMSPSSGALRAYGGDLVASADNSLNQLAGPHRSGNCAGYKSVTKHLLLEAAC